MKTRRFGIFASLAGTILMAGCATSPDPAKICTADWIEPRAERALNRLEDRTESSIRAIRKAGASYVAGDTPGPLTLLSLRTALNDLEDEFKNGPGTRDLRLLARTCNDPDFIKETLTNWLDRQDFPSQLIAFLEATTLLDRLIALAEGDVAADQKS